MKGFAARLDALDSGPVIVRSDAEPAIGDVVKEAVSRREEKTELQLSPKGALGAAEATNFAVESQLRTMRLGLLARYPSEKVSGENRLVAWMVRHCGWLLTRFQMKATLGERRLAQGLAENIDARSSSSLSRCCFTSLKALDQEPLSESSCRAGTSPSGSGRSPTATSTCC